MSCDPCSETFENSCPPYANLHDTINLFNKSCADCVRVVPSGTGTTAFLAYFGGTKDDCCDVLYVFEGSSLWISGDGISWADLSMPLANNTVRGAELSFSDYSIAGQTTINIPTVPSANTLKLVFSYQTDVAVAVTATDFLLYFNGDTLSTNYSLQFVLRASAAVILPLGAYIPYPFLESGSGGLPVAQTYGEIIIYKSNDTNLYTKYHGQTYYLESGARELSNHQFSGEWRNTANVTSMDLTGKSASLITKGYVELYNLDDVSLVLG